MATRVPGPSAAPPPPEVPKPGEDALSSILGPPTSEQWSDRSEKRRLGIRILGVLQSANKPLTIEQLTNETKASFMDLSDVLGNMEMNGDIVVEGEPGEELVRLHGIPSEH